MNTNITVLLLAAVIAGGALGLALLVYSRTRGRTVADRATESLIRMQQMVETLQHSSAEQIQFLRQSVERLSESVTRTLGEASRSFNERLDNTQRTMGELQRSLGELQQSTRNMQQVGEDIRRLQEALRAPKFRGGLGELMLADLLAQILPPEHYELQYRFPDGVVVDAAIRLSSGIVPVDAKFPLSNFPGSVEQGGEKEWRQRRRDFLRDVRKHISDIAAKYIRPDQGTFDFALMYIPAENVYYETIIKTDDPSEDSLFGFAIARRVIPVSPNSFYAYLQTILLGLKGMRIEQCAREILTQLGALRADLERFSESFTTMGHHLENLSKKYAESDKRLAGLQQRLSTFERLPPGSAPGSGLD
ncbi:MAG: hypothetical protein DRP22_04215 [Verrucomicrobia bacterium]|nr:MAG: hypothetical protein DRP22_04215 [Verrucomicrobiota bacterium]